MAEISKEQLLKHVKEIVSGADLQSLTSRSVRTQIEELLSIDLSSRKKEIDQLVMSELEDNNQSPSEEEQSEEEYVKAPAPKGKPVAKGRKTAAKGSDDSDEESEEEFKPTSPKKGRKKPAPKKRKAGSDDEAGDGDWKKKKKPAKKAGGGGGKKGSAFTKSYKLSEELADIVGSDVMPRHEVVKKLWAVIKERKLQDPKNKQFAICDDQLMKVIGVKRFRTFGMMKHLKEHFLEAA